MAATFDAAAEASTTGGVSPLSTPSFTVSSDPNRALIQGVQDRGNGSISTVAAAGGTPTSSGTAASNAGGARAHMFHMVAPASGSQTASMTWAGAYNDNSQIVLGAMTFAGVDQETPVADYTSANGSSNAPSVTVPNTVAGGIVVDSCAHRNLDGAVGANQTERYREISFGGGSTQEGADGGVMSWASSESLAWAIAAQRLVASGGGGGRTTKNAHTQTLGMNLGIRVGFPK